MTRSAPMCTPALLLLLVLMLASPVGAETSLPITVEPSPNGRVVTVDGAPFAEYRVDGGGKPVVWPLVGPNGLTVTRRWPLASRGPHESADHPHQVGLWFGFGQVNGVDFWHKPGRPGSKTGRGRVVHRRFVTATGGERGGLIVTENDWLDPAGEVLCRDERTFRFGATPTRRWVDFSIVWRPHATPLELGDSKEGLLAVRVAGPLRVDADQGGEIVNSQGQRNAEAWGARAAWVDYHGRIDDQLLGVAILSHPSNFRPRPRWHVRGYGLFAVNPLGEEEFPPLRGYRQGPQTINVGDSLRLRYRVVMHLGNEQQADIESMYRDYAAR